MWIALSVVVLLVHLAVHEAAHALALRRLGGNIKEAGLGLPFWPRLRTQVMVPSRDRSQGPRPLTLSLSPWILGAYVEPDDASLALLERASYRDRAWFAGAGVVANLLLGLSTFAVLLVGHGRYLSAVILVAVGVLVWVGRKLVTAAMPVLGIAILVWLVVALAGSLGEANGPVGTARWLAETNGLESLLILATELGLGLAAVNCIPIFPFDGGRVADAALTDLFGAKVSGRFRSATGVFAAVLILYSLVSDWL
jgi:membrane-associated protease RseP (regulator of RpoE activity)